MKKGYSNFIDFKWHTYSIHVMHDKKRLFLSRFLDEHMDGHQNNKSPFQLWTTGTKQALMSLIFELSVRS